MDHDNIIDIATYLRQFGPLLAARILETYPPLQSAKDPVAPGLAALLREPLPAQALAITGTAKYLRKAKAARIVAGPAFQPSESLKALVYFEGGDLDSLAETTRQLLIHAATAVGDLPSIPVVDNQLTIG